MSKKNDPPSTLSDEELAKLAGYEGDQEVDGLPLESAGADDDEPEG